MATAIHHGPPGSFKSFTLVQRFAIPALIEGRAIVTNIRGFNSVDRVIEQYPEIEFSSAARIIWVDTVTQAGRLRMAKWFHWVPFGSVIIIDEVQQIYPDRRDFKLESLDHFFPEPNETIESTGIPEGRPEDVFTAYDKQRHYNWDIYLSTPNIAKVKKEIREVSEWAYRHRDLSGLLPWYKNKWAEHQHDPEQSGKSKSHCVGSANKYKADPRVFKCYDSTATGEHKKSKAGRTIFQDKKIQGLLLLLAVCIIYGAYAVNHYIDVKNKPSTNNAPVSPPAQTDYETAAVPGSSAVSVVHGKNATPDHDKPLTIIDRDHALKWSISGIDQQELKTLPVSCSVSRNSVRCQQERDPAILQVAKNHICIPLFHSVYCNLIFFINRDDLQQNDKGMALAKAMPFH